MDGIIITDPKGKKSMVIEFFHVATELQMLLACEKETIVSLTFYLISSSLLFALIAVSSPDDDIQGQKTKIIDC